MGHWRWLTMIMKIDTILRGLLKASFSDHDSVKAAQGFNFQEALYLHLLLRQCVCVVETGRKKIFRFPLKIVELEDWEILKVERKSNIGIRLTQVEYNVYSNIFEYRITTGIEAWWLL